MEDRSTRNHDSGSQPQQDPTISSSSTSTQHFARIINLSKSASSQQALRKTTVGARPTVQRKLPVSGVDNQGTIPGSAPIRNLMFRAPLHQIQAKEHQAGTRLPAISSITTRGGLITFPQKRHRKTRTAFWVRSSSTLPQQQYCLIVALRIPLLHKSLRKSVV